MTNNEFRIQCREISGQIMRSCGLAYETYIQRLSPEIEKIINSMPTENRATAIEIARNEFDYVSVNDLDKYNNVQEDGFCKHGLQLECCPSGCGDIDG